LDRKARGRRRCTAPRSGLQAAIGCGAACAGTAQTSMTLRWRGSLWVVWNTANSFRWNGRARQVLPADGAPGAPGQHGRRCGAADQQCPKQRYPACVGAAPACCLLVATGAGAQGYSTGVYRAGIAHAPLAMNDNDPPWSAHNAARAPAATSANSIISTESPMAGKNWPADMTVRSASRSSHGAAVTAFRFWRTSPVVDDSKLVFDRSGMTASRDRRLWSRNLVDRHPHADPA